MDLADKKLLKRASRSVIVSITNNTTETLFRTCFRLKSGKWFKFPGELIDPNETLVFASESYGMMTGTEGSVTFQMWEDQKPLEFHWSNPFFGSPKTETFCGDGFTIETIQKLGSLIDVHFIVEDPYRETRQETKPVKSTPVVHEQWIVDMRQTQCSILIKVHNKTAHTLYLTENKLEHGIWRNVPPEIIEPNSVGYCGAENHGLTGTKGELQYRVDIRDDCSVFLPFYWKVPLLSDPKFDHKVYSCDINTRDKRHFVADLFFSSDETYFLETVFDTPPPLEQHE